MPVTDPAAAPVMGFILTAHNAAGTIMGGGGPIPLAGVAKVCLFALCIAPPLANLTIPLGVVGTGGAATVATLVNVTAIGAPWTVGTVRMRGRESGSARAEESHA